MKEQVKLNVFYPHPPEKVWQALTDCRILNAWMMKNDFKPRLGHKFKFESNSLPGIKTIIHCEVVKLEKPKRLAYTWQDEITSEPSLVIWTLNPAEGGTQLQLQHQHEYATTFVAGMSPDLKQINTRPGLFIYEQPTSNFNKQTYHTSSVQMAAREELNSLLNHKDSKEEWNYRLNYQLPQTLQNHMKSI
ncbi:MAG: SRPBCC domain-containing protein [Pleurocapsa sp. CRU_1_2]|nr:SRPBCC domain-containing protein [Pleurocapsa sp. CRU_1_2]